MTQEAGALRAADPCLRTTRELPQRGWGAEQIKTGQRKGKFPALGRP